MRSIGFTRYGAVAAAGAAFLLFATLPARASEKVVHSFGSSARDGAFPLAGLINVSSKLYGTTSGGGAAYGTVFSVTPAGVEKVVYSFKGASARDGEGPPAGLIYLGGKLYGTTFLGGDYGDGAVFSVTPAGVEKVVYSFKGEAGRDGASPYAGLIYLGGKLYGTTSLGGTQDEGGNGSGTVFSVTP